MVLIICCPLQSKNIKWKMWEMNNSQVLNCMPFCVAWWNLIPSLLLCPARDVNRPFAQHICATYVCYLPVDHLVAILVMKSTIVVLQSCVQVTLMLHNNGPKASIISINVSSSSPILSSASLNVLLILLAIKKKKLGYWIFNSRISVSFLIISFFLLIFSVCTTLSMYLPLLL